MAKKKAKLPHYKKLVFRPAPELRKKLEKIGRELAPQLEADEAAERARINTSGILFKVIR